MYISKISCTRKIAGVALATAITLSPQLMAGGIPVIDASSLAQNILQVQHMLSQIQELQAQLETANKTLDSMSGSRGLASVVNTAYDVAINVDPGSVLANAGIKSATDHGLSGDVATLYDSSNQNAALWLGQSQKSLEQSQERFADLAGLVAKVNASPDQKDILDLQARISAEAVFLQNEQAKLAMLRSQAEANQAIQTQRIQQMAIESFGEPKNIDW